MRLDRLLRYVLHRFFWKGVNTGIDHVSRNGKDVKELTPEERGQAHKRRKRLMDFTRLARLLRMMSR